MANNPKKMQLDTVGGGALMELFNRHPSSEDLTIP